MNFSFYTLAMITVLSLSSGCSKRNSHRQNKPTAKSSFLKESPKPIEKPFKYCSAYVFCKDLSVQEARCRKNQNEKNCFEFVSIFKKLSVKNDCKRKFDIYTVPSVWICDEYDETSSYPKIFERSVQTLSKLKFSLSRKFYGSDAFRSTLDGALAKDHFEKSLSIRD